MNKLNQMLKGIIVEERINSFTKTYNYFSSLYETYDGTKYRNEMDELMDMLDEGFYYIKEDFELPCIKYRPIDILYVDCCVSDFEEFWNKYKTKNRLCNHLAKFANKFNALVEKIYSDNFRENLAEIVVEFQDNFTFTKSLFTNVCPEVVASLRDVYGFMDEVIDYIDELYGDGPSTFDKLASAIYTQCISILGKYKSNNVPDYIIEFSENLTKLTKTEEFKLLFADGDLLPIIEEFAKTIKKHKGE